MKISNNIRTIGIVLVAVIFIALGLALASKKYGPAPSEQPFAIGEEGSFAAIAADKLSEKDYERYRQAVEILNNEPKDRASLLNLGYLYRQAGKYEEVKRGVYILTQ